MGDNEPMVVKSILIRIWKENSKMPLFGCVGNIAMDMGRLGFVIE